MFGDVSFREYITNGFGSQCPKESVLMGMSDVIPWWFDWCVIILVSKGSTIGGEDSIIF